MELTPEEARMVERLRKQEQQWKWGRWALLVTGVLLGGVSFFSIRQIQVMLQTNGGSPDISTVIAIQILYPKALLMIMASGLIVGWVLHDWRGNAKRVLLLKLISHLNNSKD